MRGAAAILSVLAALTAPAGAQVVVSYSPATNAYGFCGEGDSACARRWCAADGATDCAPIATCGRGWIAIAAPERPHRGITVVCGMDSPQAAQMLALASCLEAANDLCWNGHVLLTGGEDRERDVVREFDRLFYAQSLLALSGQAAVLVSGEEDRATIAAIGAFQARLGLPATGLTEPPLIFTLLAAAGGRQALVDAVVQGVGARNRAQGHRAAVAFAADPAPRRTQGAELLAMPPENRTLALASFLAARGFTCDRTKATASAWDTTGELWTLACPEADYDVILTTGGAAVTTRPRSDRR